MGGKDVDEDARDPLPNVPEICASVVVAEECTLQQACCPSGVEEQMQEDERVDDLVVRAGHFVPLD